MPWQKVTIGETLRRAARATPEREFVIGDSRRLTFAAFDALVDDFAEGLLRAGFRRGDHLALWMTNTPDWLLVWLGCARIGVVTVPLNTRYKAQEAEYILRQSDAKALVMMDRFWDIDFYALAREAIPGLESQEPGRIDCPTLPHLRSVIVWNDAALPGTMPLRTLLESGRRKQLLPAAEAAVDPDDPLIIVYTSGTTGKPKGAVHSHAILRNGANIARWMHIEPGDRILGHMPFYHVAGAIAAVTPALLQGCTIVTLAHWDPHEALHTIARERIAIFGGIPTHFIDLIDQKKADPVDTSCLKSAWIGGADVSPTVAQAARDVLTIEGLMAVYGMTETSAVTTFARFEDPISVTCDNRGLVVGEFEVAVVDPATGTVRPVGEVGEIRVRGHNVMLGYYENPEATRECMTEDGWFKTGDLGRFDTEGYLKITGRAKEMFIVGGSNAYPAEIESFMQAHPAVKQAVVVGVPHPRLGEVGYAFVQLDGDTRIEAGELVRYCREHMADYKVPRTIVFVDDFPRTTTGKIQRFVLAEQARATVAA